MKLWHEISGVRDFEYEAWGPARDTLEYLTSEQKDQLDNMLDDIFPDGCSATEFNDWLAYDDDSIAEMLGFASFEELMRHNDEEEE